MLADTNVCNSIGVSKFDQVISLPLSHVNSCTEDVMQYFKIGLVVNILVSCKHLPLVFLRVLLV
jgi:hypothetical protein